MDFHNWEAEIKENLLQLRISGLWPTADFYQKDLYTAWSVIVVVIFIGGHTTTQFIYLCLNLNDLETLTQASFVLLSQIGGLFKLYYLVRNMRILKKLMKTLKTRWFQPKNATQKALAVGSLKPWRALYRMYWCSCLFTVFFIVSYPLLDGSYRGYRLPYSAWFPFDTKTSPNYQIVYLFQVISLFFIACYVLGIDFLIAALNVYITAQFELLSDTIQRLFDSPKAEFTRNLVECVLHHKEILDFTRICNKFFNWIVFIQFFVSATSLAITMFQMTRVDPTTSEFGVFLCFETTVIVQLFMFCWFGNEVAIKSEIARDSIFESNWTRAPPRVQKTLLFFALKCQKPVKISALSLFYLSLDTFMTILKTSWSYFTLLKTMASDD